METSSDNSSTSGTAPVREKTEAHGLFNLKQKFKNKGFSDATVNVMCAGWADSTHKQYNSYFKKWHNFCEERNCNSIESDLKTIIDFLTYLHYQGYSYSGINTAKSALMSLVTVNNSSSWSLDPDLNRFIKGIYNIKPPLPKYSSTWDVDIVLRFLSNWMPLSDSTLKELTLKAVTLVALVSGNRAQSIHQMKLNLFH